METALLLRSLTESGVSTSSLVTCVKTLLVVVAATNLFMLTSLNIGLDLQYLTTSPAVFRPLTGMKQKWESIHWARKCPDCLLTVPSFAFIQNPSFEGTPRWITGLALTNVTIKWLHFLITLLPLWLDVVGHHTLSTSRSKCDQLYWDRGAVPQFSPPAKITD